MPSGIRFIFCSKKTDSYRPKQVLKLLQTLPFLTMPKDLLISMLRKGQNGDEILAILDTITNEQETEPTLEEIKF